MPMTKQSTMQNDNDSRENILACAKTEFAEHGFDGARMAVIARNAGVNKALIHYYFKSKDALYFEVIKRIFGNNITAMDFPVYTGNLDFTPSQKLYIYIYFLVHSHLRGADQESIRIFFWEIAAGEKYLKYFMEKYTMPRHQKLLEIIKEGIRNGEFECLNPELSVVQLFSFINFYTIDLKLSGGTRSLHGLKHKDISEVTNFIVYSSFKSLWPVNKPFTLPDVPGDFLNFVDTMLDLLTQRKEEGIYDQMVRHIDKMLGGT